MDNKSMSRDDFLKLLQAAKKDTPTKAPTGGSKADWEKILKDIQSLGRPAGLKEIQERFVQGVVVRRRTKNVMEDYYIKSLKDLSRRPWVTRVYNSGAYWYFVVPDEQVDAVQNALKKSGSLKMQLASLKVK